MKGETGLPQILRFGAFEIDLRSGEIYKGGHRLKLQDQPFQVLVALVERPGELVAREDLQKKLWPGDTFVDFDSGLNRAINKIREVLDDSADSPRFVETLPRRGYRFIAPVQAVGERPAKEAAPTPSPESLVVRPASGQTLGRRLALAFAGFGIAAAATWGVVAWRIRRSPEAPPRIRSIVVLPLENVSGDPGQEYFADGMTDELTTLLAKITSLRVISRTSAMAYKGKGKALPVIARELNVDAVVEGTVFRSGRRVRITAQLIQAATDRHLWANSYERDVGDVLKLQSQIAQAIADAVEVQLTMQEHARLSKSHKVDPQAYEDYLKGMYLWNQRTEEGFERSIDYFKNAIALDPTDPQPYAGLADSYIMLGILGFQPPRQVYPVAKTAALKALELDDTSAPAHTALADIIKGYEWNWDDAEKEYRRAIDLNPNYAIAHMWYANLLSIMGRHSEALAEVKQAQELDPLSLSVNAFAGFTYLRARQYGEALRECQKALELGPQLPLGHWFLGQAYVAQRNFPEATEQLEQAVNLSGGGPLYLASLGYAYGVAGDRARAVAALDRLRKESGQRYVSPFDVAIVYLGLGNRPATFQWLEKAYQERTMRLTELPMPMFDTLRTDPRFRDLEGRIGIPLQQKNQEKMGKVRLRKGTGKGAKLVASRPKTWQAGVR